MVTERYQGLCNMKKQNLAKSNHNEKPSPNLPKDPPHNFLHISSNKVILKC